MNSLPTSAPQGQLEESPGCAWSNTATLALLGTFVVCTCVFFNSIGSFPLFNPDEALYAEPAREMLTNGDWLTTHLNYIVRYTKPPLVIWAQALLMSVLGVSEFSARSFGAACGVMLVLLTQIFVTRYVGLRAGLVAAASLISAPLFFGTARECITDMPLSLFLAAGFMAFYAAFREKSNKLFAMLGYVCIALAVMTKGPVAIVLPVAVLGFFHLTTGTLKEAWSRYLPILGFALVAVITLPWFIAEIIVTNGEYFQEFFVRENFQRFTSVVDSHKGPIWYHVAAVMGGFFPFSLYLPQALITVCLQLKEKFMQLSSLDGPLDKIWGIPKTLNQLEQRAALQFYTFLWLLITVAFFSASVSKLMPYTLPAFPAAATLFALEIERGIASRGRWRLLAPIALVAVVYGCLLFAGPWIISKIRHLPDGVAPLVQPATIGMSIAMVIAVLAGFLNRKQVAIGVTMVAHILLVTLLAPPLVQALSKQWEGPIPEFSRYVGKVEEPAFVFDMRKPGVPFYAGRQMSQAWTWATLTSELSRMKRGYVITRARNKGPFLELPGFTVIKEEGLYILIRFDNPFDVKVPYTPSPGIHSMQR